MYHCPVCVEKSRRGKLRVRATRPMLESEIAVDALPRHDFPERLPALPGPADDGPPRIALVRRRPGGVDHLHAVLPDGAARGIRLCALARITLAWLAPARLAARDEARGVDSYRAARGVAHAGAHRAKREILETGAVDTNGERQSFRPHSPAARRDGGCTVFPAVGDRAAAAALVSLR